MIVVFSFIVEFDLPVHIETQGGAKITSEGLQLVYTYLSSDIGLLNKQLQRSEKISCVCISKISVKDTHLVFKFILEDKKELHEFFELSKTKRLSAAFSKYSDEYPLQIQAGFGLLTKLKYTIEMDEENYKNAVRFFESNER